MDRIVTYKSSSLHIINSFWHKMYEWVEECYTITHYDEFISFWMEDNGIFSSGKIHPFAAVLAISQLIASWIRHSTTHDEVNKINKVFFKQNRALIEILVGSQRLWFNNRWLYDIWMESYSLFTNFTIVTNLMRYGRGHHTIKCVSLCFIRILHSFAYLCHIWAKM